MAKRKPTNEHEPDFIDARNAADALWTDFGLYFRASMVWRSGRLLMRAYAHDDPSLTASSKVYQTYKTFAEGPGISTTKLAYLLALELYQACDIDRMHAILHQETSVTLADVPEPPALKD